MEDEIIGDEYVPSREELAANAVIAESSKVAEELEKQRLATRDSALKKLAKLGLTEDEARAVIGF